MPDDKTAFVGRQDPRVEVPYKAALSQLSRETYVAFRDARAGLIRERVEDFLGLTPASETPKESLASA